MSDFASRKTPIIIQPFIERIHEYCGLQQVLCLFSTCHNDKMSRDFIIRCLAEVNLSGAVALTQAEAFCGKYKPYRVKVDNVKNLDQLENVKNKLTEKIFNLILFLD